MRLMFRNLALVGAIMILQNISARCRIQLTYGSLYREKYEDMKRYRSLGRTCFEVMTSQVSENQLGQN